MKPTIPFLRVLVLTLAALASVDASAQTSLSIVDALPPYLLSARLLRNGHFSITTRYTGEPKTLVYQEDGSGGRPINYTSFVHFKVDDVIFQLPFELDPVRRDPPPQHPLAITELFRDTVDGRPRVNARMFGVMPDGDTMRFTFTMQPVTRPSGGFIRLEAEAHNSSGRSRSVGVLMLVDTKIGDNDRAPIVTAFGYRTRETEHRRAVAPGMPDYWLALEGTPTAPGLTARGNLRASGLIEPDLFLAGNWKDNTAVPGATGLGTVMWKERSAFDVEYTDSAVLLVWDEQSMAPGERRLRAATEIGIVDSLAVRRQPGVDLALGGAGLGDAEGCVEFDTLRDRSCAMPHPYHPDPLQTLYLATNTGSAPQANVRLEVGALPPGLTAEQTSAPFLPSTLEAGETGVTVLSFRAVPRLWSRTYMVPITLFADGLPALSDSICVVVPGLLGRLDARSASAGPLCPGAVDTLDVPIRLDGARCLPLEPAIRLEGPPSEVERYEILDPVPARLPSMGEAIVRVRHTAGPNGTSSRVRLIVSATEQGLNDWDRDTTVVIADTALLSVESRDAELQFADVNDTLDFGAICVGDSTMRTWPVANIGGCDLVIREDYRFESDPLGQFAMADEARFPLLVPGARDERIRLRFAPRQAGVALARLIVSSDAVPFLDTLYVRGRGDVPAYELGTPTMPDTICVGERFEATIPIVNPTGCAVEITGVTLSNARFTTDAAGLVLPPHSTRRLVVAATLTQPGSHSTDATVSFAGLAPSSVRVGVVVVERNLIAPSTLELGEVRVGTTGAATVTYRAEGTAPVVVQRVRVVGPNAAEYEALPTRPLPAALAPGEGLVVDVRFTPDDLERRHATLVIETSEGMLCSTAPIVELAGRGVLPLLDAPRRRFVLDRRCVAQTIDTTLTVRNRGNGVLTISRADVESTPSLDVQVAGLPIVLPPDGTHQLALRITPRGLGPIDARMRLTHDGAWLTAPDTAITVSVTGVLCGTIWADTMRASVGDRVEVPVRIAAPGLSGADVAVLLAGAHDSVALAATFARDQLLPRSGTPVAGWLSKPGAGTVTGVPGAVRVEGRVPATGEGSVIATLPVDVLLGTTDRTPLALAVGAFAGGYADLRVRDGLVIAEYCAIDKRYVRTDGLWLAAASTPLQPGGTILVHMPSEAHATATLHDTHGGEVARLADGVLSAGTSRLLLPWTVPSGTYTVALRTPSGVASLQVLIVK